MKSWRSWLFLCFTLLVLVIGFFLPRVVSEIGDTALVIDKERMAADQIQFETQSAHPDVFHALQRYQGSILLFDAQEVEPNLTAEQVYEISWKMLAYLQGWGVNDVWADYFSGEACPIKVVDPIAESFSVIWECRLYEENGSALLLRIDDQTGLMLSCETEWLMQENGMDESAWKISWEDRESLLQNGKLALEQTENAALWQEICRDYYGFAKVDLSYSDSEGLLNETTDPTIVSDRPEGYVFEASFRCEDMEGGVIEKHYWKSTEGFGFTFQ